MNRQELIKKAIAEMTLLDDIFMAAVFDNNIEATQLVLNIILDRDDLEVIEVVSQREYKNVTGRSIRLDILARDGTGKVYDIEIQRLNNGAGSRRARFYSSMLDTKLLKAREDFDALTDTYVIFITENDVLGGGLPIYHIDRTVAETGAAFGDGAHIIYVNSAIDDRDTALSRLMHDFRCLDDAEMNYSAIADRVHFFKKEERGNTNMGNVMDNLIKLTNEIAAQEAAQAASRENARETARNFIKEGNIAYEVIARCTGLSLEEVKEIAEGMSA